MKLVFRHGLFASVMASALLQVASAGTIVVTPGSLAGYTYFPPGSGVGSGGGGGSENVSTLLRCYVKPTLDDRTVDLSTRDWLGFDRPITVYYKAWGGNGGSGYNGGGGGSSALLKNGTPIVIAPGGDGGNSAPMTSGYFTVAKTDTLRFILGGGGGSGAGSGASYLGGGTTPAYFPAVGGGGGAGYAGGGGGGSATGQVAGAPVAAGGKGGGAAAGAGGTIPGGALYSGASLPGTAGAGQSGGVATYPDGSSAPIGSSAGNYYSQTTCNNYDYSTSTYITSRFPAQPTRNGSIMVGGTDPFAPYIQYGGGGGRLGVAGTPAGLASASYNCNYSYAVAAVTTTNQQIIHSNYSPPNCGDPQNNAAYGGALLCTAKNFPEITDGFVVQHDIVNPLGTIPGNIALMYQAPSCDIIPRYDAP